MVHFKPKLIREGWEREKIKIILLFHSYSRSDRKFQKNGKNIHKLKKYHCGFIFSQNRLEMVGKERK